VHDGGLNCVVQDGGLNCAVQDDGLNIHLYCKLCCARPWFEHTLILNLCQLVGYLVGWVVSLICCLFGLLVL
jgi:hypothetical protein